MKSLPEQGLEPSTLPTFHARKITQKVGDGARRRRGVAILRYHLYGEQL